MTAINSSFSGVNAPVADAYLRNLHEFRVNAEVALLPVINYLVAQTEDGRKRLPAQLLEHQKPYLEALARRYHKREFRFLGDEEPEDPAYRALAQLLHKTKKTVSYCLNDLYDLMHESGLALHDLKVHDNILLLTKEVAQTYHKRIPPVIASRLEELSSPRQGAGHCEGTAAPSSPSTRACEKFATPFQLYAAILGSVKRTIDFEALKLYDFLLETDQEVLRSDALLEIAPSVRKLGEGEYVKRPFIRRMAPLGEKDYLSPEGRERVFLEEWGSNIRRALELKTLLAYDLLAYLKEDTLRKPGRLLLAGHYPELREHLAAAFPQPLEALLQDAPVE
jgi:hypothetical protein